MWVKIDQRPSLTNFSSFLLSNSWFASYNPIKNPIYILQQPWLSPVMTLVLREPQSIPPQIAPNITQTIGLYHPIYDDSILTLYAYDHPDGGLHFNTAFVACAMVAGNAWRDGDTINIGRDGLLIITSCIQALFGPRFGSMRANRWDLNGIVRIFTSLTRRKEYLALFFLPRCAG